MLIPWSMINLLDFYVVKQQRYDIAAIFRADGGRYGLVNTNALLIYFGGVVVQIPFVENAFFTGPYAHLIPGADISWGTSLAVTSCAYLLFHIRRPDRYRNAHRRAAGRAAGGAGAPSPRRRDSFLARFPGDAGKCRYCCSA
nr:hypothetical protein [Candidatus Pantoea persica]MBA2813911.1 Permease for allantoin and cytosine [Candidatus Pantoea persica]